MIRVLGGFLLLAISSTALGATTLTSIPTWSDADILNEQIQTSTPLTTQKMRELFEKSPDFNVTCFPSEKVFLPVPPSNEKMKSPDSVWMEYSDDFNLPSKLSPSQPLSGRVSFVYKPAGRAAFDLSAYISLQVAETEVRYLLAAPAKIACEFDNAGLCNALVGVFSGTNLKLDEVIDATTIKDGKLVSVSSKSQFGIYLTQNGPPNLLMRIASKLSTEKEGEHKWNPYVEGPKYTARYICTLSPIAN